MGNNNILKQAELNNKLRYVMYSHNYVGARRLVENGVDPN